MPALYSRLTAAALVGTALQVIADNSSNSSENTTENASENTTENASENTTENASENTTENASENTTEENSSDNATEENSSDNATEENSDPTPPQIEVHVVKVTMNTSMTVAFPDGTNVSQLLATPETKAKTKTALEKDYQAALDASTSSSRRESDDDTQSPWKVEVTKMEAQGATQLDVDAAVVKSVDSASGAPTDTAKNEIAAKALADTKTFLKSSKLKMGELAAVYKNTTGDDVPAEFTLANTSVSDEVSTVVETEKRDDPNAGLNSSTAAPTTTSTGGPTTSPPGVGMSSSGVSSSSLVACVLLMAARFMC